MSEISLVRYVLWIPVVLHLEFLRTAVLCANNTFGGDKPADVYLLINQRQCFVSRKLLSCLKYKMAKSVWGLATNKYNYFHEETGRAANVDSSSFDFVHLSQPSKDELFSNIRSIQDDSETAKVWKFVKRSFQAFLQRHGVQIPLLSESGVKINEVSATNLEPRGDKRKKKWLVILPLIILMKIAHLKMTVVFLLLGVGGLQLLGLAGMAYIIHHLKTYTFCKIHPHLVQTHSFSPELEYSTFSGGYHHSSDYGGGYSKDWNGNQGHDGYNYVENAHKHG